MIEDEEFRKIFQAESEDKLRSLEEQIRKLEAHPQDQEAIETAFRDAHTIKGSARMLNLQSIETITHQLESYLDRIRKREMPLSTQGTQILYEVVYAIQALVNEAITGQAANIELSSILKNLDIKTLTAHKVSSEESKKIEQSLSETQPIPSPSLPFEQVLKEISPIHIQPEPSSAPTKRAEKAKQSPSFSTVRIDTQQISQLIHQTADLMVAKNRMIRLFERLEDLLNKWERKYHAHQPHSLISRLMEKEGRYNHTFGTLASSTEAIFEAFKEIGENLGQLRTDTYEDIHKLDVIASSLNDQIQKLSLLPLSRLFDFFPRMVRDLAKMLEKDIELIIEGGEITVDKKIIEDMKDPLMHLLRNALSHGIESAEERKQKGKSPKGCIQLIGKRTPNSILIEISDDGRGLDLEKIKTIAIQRQIISEKDALTLTPAQIHALIFLPGFSTTSQVSDISGRGVGLDVVKNEVEKLHGTLTLSSVPNQGCCFSIELPIFHITTQVMLVTANQHMYALPMDVIEACLFVSVDQISRIDGYDVIVIDSQPLPLIYLKNMILETAEDNNFTSHACMIIKVQEKRMAIIVDAIIDEQKVIVNPPTDLLSSVKSMVGTTILKTGEVCIILNPSDLGRVVNC